MVLSIVLPSITTAVAPQVANDESPYSITPEGVIKLNVPPEQWRISGVWVKARTDFARESLLYEFRISDDSAVAFDVRRALSTEDAQAKSRPSTLPTEVGFNMVVGGKGAGARETVSAAITLDAHPASTIPYGIYERLAADQKRVQWAVPFALGDSYKGHPVVATLASVFGRSEEGKPLPAPGFQFTPDRFYEFSAGAPFHSSKFEAVIGDALAMESHLTIGDKIRLTHGYPAPQEQADVHEQDWTVVGILKHTETASDKSVYVPLVGFNAVPEHAKGLRGIARMNAARDKSAPGR